MSDNFFLFISSTECTMTLHNNMRMMMKIIFIMIEAYTIWVWKIIAQGLAKRNTNMALPEFAKTSDIII